MKKALLTMTSIAALTLAACSEEVQEDPRAAAERIAQETIITDGHIDVPYRLENKWVDVSEATDGGDFDYPRAKAGGLDAPFMSIYIPATTPEDGAAFALANKLIDSMEKLVNDVLQQHLLLVQVTYLKQLFKKVFLNFF